MTTHPEAKKIFVLEDLHKQLETYIQFLNREGFYVKGAKNLEEVEEISESNESFDLLLLDMVLKEDPKALDLNMYGSDVGERLIKKQTAWPPEVLTMTSYDGNVDLWRRSFAIGAAALLEKRRTTLEVTINYVRVLLLRRAVSLNNPRCKEIVRDVLKNSGREYQMLEDFFRQLILPEFDACLGVPFILVLERAEASGEEAMDAHHAREQKHEAALKEEIAELVAKASYYTQINELQEPLRLDEEVLHLAALPAGKSISQVFFSARLDELSGTEKSINTGSDLTELLEDAAFIPLQLTPGTRLSLLLLKDKKLSKNSGDSLPLPLAKLLAKYSLDSLRMTLTNLIERWKQEQEIKRVQLQELARFCEYVGAETKRITFEAGEEGLVPEKSTNFHKLTLLADELCEAGEFLSDLAQESLPQSQRLILQEVIQEAWDSLRESSGRSPGDLSFHGDCRAAVMAVKEGLLFSFSRLLHWLVSFYEEDIGMTSQISVDCRLEGPYIELSLESDSVRLNKILRDKIFVPMTQRINYNQVPKGEGPKLFLALYLAKTVLEKRYKGSLVDHSDELPENVGHKLVIKMPVLNK
jgi:DNA-binding response OmpR family regulator